MHEDVRLPASQVSSHEDSPALASMLFLTCSRLVTATPRRVGAESGVVAPASVGRDMTEAA